MIKYVKFFSNGYPIKSEQCTTEWPNTIKCRIPLNGIIDGIFYNIMIMEGPEEDLDNWLKNNVGKVNEMTKDETNELGCKIMPEGAELPQYNPMGGLLTTLVAGKFDIDGGDCNFTTKENIKVF